MNEQFTHFLRIGIHNEAEYFQKSRPLYDALIINANLVEATSSACAALIYRLDKPFFIDPFTHAFSLNHKYLMSKGKGKSQDQKVKRSFAGLGARYFTNSSFLGKRPLSPADFEIEPFTDAVLHYQQTVLEEAGDELVTMVGADRSIFRPTWLIAPYFPIRKSMSWLEANLKCLEVAIRKQKEGACATIAIELSALRLSWSDIVDRYAALKPPVVFLWIESFDEDRAEESDLEVYCSFVKKLTDNGIRVVNLFGGFFSCLAHCVGLAGFAHGLVYGENKSFTPVVGGGQPPPRYYLKPAHVSMNVREAELLLSGVVGPSYLADVCDCTICTGLFSGNDELTNFAEFSKANDQGKFMPKAYALCRYHFLLARRAEIVQMEPLSPKERLEAIRRNVAFLQSIDAENYADHLLTWIRVIDKACGM